MDRESVFETDTYRPVQAEDFLENPIELRRFLKGSDALTFKPYPSGLFPASNLSPDVAKATGMGMAWLRDNAHIASALYESGDPDDRGLAISAGKALLKVLHKNRDILDDVVSGRDTTRRIPVRVDGVTLEKDTEERVQNDATGYVLWFVGRLLADEALDPSEKDLAVMAQTVRYLDAIDYRFTPDAGHWEEDDRINPSSIGTVHAGLQSVRLAFERHGYHHDINFDRLIRDGTSALHALIRNKKAGNALTLGPDETLPDIIDVDDIVRQFFVNFNTARRAHDASLLFLIEPLNTLDEGWAALVVRDIEEHLVRDRGIARYPGDTYWEPRFTDIMDIDARTSVAEGRTEWRNQTAAGIAYTYSEAQWSLFDPLLSVYWGKIHLETGDSEAQQKQQYYLNRSLSQLAHAPDGRLLWPEAHYLEHGYNPDTGVAENRWIANPHTPLLWTQANVLRALKVFEASYRA